MTPPPFSFELLVTGLCLITLQGPTGRETGATFQFLDAPANQEVCGTTFDTAHVPSLTFDLGDLGDGSSDDYQVFRTPDGHYVGRSELKGKNLCLKVFENPLPAFGLEPGRSPGQQMPKDPDSMPNDHDAFGWVTSLSNVDDRQQGLGNLTDKMAGSIQVGNGTLKSAELGRTKKQHRLVVWKLEGDHVPTQASPDFPKVLAGSVALRLDHLTDRVELVDCTTKETRFVFGSEQGGIVRVVAANLPEHKITGTYLDPMIHMLWYYNLLDWNTASGTCPDDVALPATVLVTATDDGIEGGTGSSVFCPPVKP